MPIPPKISIITPSYNQGHLIDHTIRSVLDQNYENLEYIVVDGGSTDNTVDVLKRYSARLRWISEKDRGQSDAINKGLRMSSGDIIAFLNSDDLYEPGALHTVANFFIQHSEVQWLTGYCRIIDVKGNEIRRSITAYKNFLLRHFSHPLLLVTNPISQPATFWRRQVVEEHGEFDINDQFVMDYEYWLRVGAHSPPAILPFYLASFRIHEASKMSGFYAHRQWLELQVAKRYSRSTLLNFLHYLNYAGIIGSYALINFVSRIRSMFSRQMFSVH